MSKLRTWKAGPDDAQTLVHLERAAFEDRSWGFKSVADSFKAPGVEVLFAGPVEDDAAAFAIWRAAGGEAELLSIGVTPDRRCRGLGGTVLQAVINGAKALNASVLFLEVDAGNDAAIGLYRNHGFDEVGMRKAYYRNGADALVFRKTL